MLHRLPGGLLALAAVVAAGCGPLDHSGQRSLVTDETPLGTRRAEVHAWQLANDWCEARTWTRSDEYVTCVPRAYEGREDDRLHTFFRFEGDVAVASAVYAPVPCTHRDCTFPLGVTTALEDAPFVVFDDGLVTAPTTAGREAALSIQMPGDQARLMDALSRELVARYGLPAWTSASGTAMVWHAPREQVGLFLAADGMWTVETHQLSPGYGS